MLNAPALSAMLPLPPITPPCAPLAVVPAALTSAPLVVIASPSAPSETMRPAVLSSEPACVASAPFAWIVPRVLLTAPAAFSVTACCETICPLWFDRLAACRTRPP
ncbi:hypothetical protein D3C81_1260590 [compost metagenome]